MAGILGYLSLLADDISSLATKTVATTGKSIISTLDDIGTLFDDVATYTKLASVKSTGLVVDDLAAIASFTNETTSDILKKLLNDAKNVSSLKEKVNNLTPKEKEKVIIELEKIKALAIEKARENASKREIPIVYKIAKGSFINKCIIIPIILTLSYIAPFLIPPILILGGSYLCFEAIESILEKISTNNKDDSVNNSLEKLNCEELENIKVKSAIKTDFILSFEIMVISLSLVSDATFFIKFITIFLVGIIATVFVYGIVGIIIKLDDIGFYLQKKRNSFIKYIGNGFVVSMPILIKLIGYIGIIAMLAVGGGIIQHQTHIMDIILVPVKNIFMGNYLTFIMEIIFGLLIGFFTLLLVKIYKKIIKK